MSELNFDEVASTMSQMPKDEDAKSLSELGKKLLVEMGVKEELEKATVDCDETIKSLVEVEIPNLMRTLGLEEIKLATGHTVKLIPVYSASLAEERKPEGYKWLEDNGYGALVKTKLILEYGKGEEEEEKKKKAKVTLTKQGFEFEEKNDVHHKTLQAFVKERYEKGEQFPEKLFGAFTKTIAQIKLK